MMNYSFIIPVYNCKAYLTACVESILAAGAEDFEILLVDDGSTDGSGGVCDALGEKYSCIRVLHKANGGVSSARNAGLDAARGTYVLFVDGDDTLDSHRLSELMQVFPKSASDMAIFGLFFDYYKDGSCYRTDLLSVPYAGVLCREKWVQCFYELFSANAVSSSCTKVLKRSIIQKYNFRFSEELFLYEDLDFVLRYMAKCNEIFCKSEPVYRYRQTEDESNAGRRLKRISRISALMAPLEEALGALIDVPREQRENVCLTLFCTLAREKIAVSSLSTIREVCADYAAWYQRGGFDREETPFHRNLMAGKAGKLYFSAKKTALRHRIAVWAKAHHLYRR